MAKPQVDNRTQPESITAAVLLLWIQLVIWVATALGDTVTLLDQAWTDPQSDAEIRLRVTWGLGVPLVATGIWLSRALWRGSHRARVVATIAATSATGLAVIDVLLAKADLASPVANLALCVALLVALTWRSSRRWCQPLS